MFHSKNCKKQIQRKGMAGVLKPLAEDIRQPRESAHASNKRGEVLPLGDEVLTKAWSASP